LIDDVLDRGAGFRALTLALPILIGGRPGGRQAPDTGPAAQGNRP
jgi:hypothetical protein